MSDFWNPKENPFAFFLYIPFLIGLYFVYQAYVQDGFWWSMFILACDAVISIVIYIVAFVLYMIYGGRDEDDYDPY